MSMTREAAATLAAQPHRSKVIAAWLALLLGAFGAHWWYVRRPGAWVVSLVTLGMLVWALRWPVWWSSPPFLLLIIPLAIASVEAVVFALMPASRFDARYNPRSQQHNRMGWPAVLTAVVATLVGSSAVLFMLSLTVIEVYKALGWLDGYVI